MMVVFLHMLCCFRFEGREADLDGGMDLVGSVSASFEREPMNHAKGSSAKFYLDR